MDIPTLAEELGREEADVRRLVLTFLDSTEQDLLLLDQAFSDQDAEGLRKTAHHIKGAAGNLELTAIAQAALAIEEKARSGNIEDPTSEITLIRSQLDSIRAQITANE